MQEQPCQRYPNEICSLDSKCTLYNNSCVFKRDLECMNKTSFATCNGSCIYSFNNKQCLSKQSCQNIENATVGGVQCSCSGQQAPNALTYQCECLDGQIPLENTGVCLFPGGCTDASGPIELNYDHTKCVCKSNAHIVGQSCQCDDGYYILRKGCVSQEQCESQLGQVSGNKCVCVAGAIIGPDEYCVCDTNNHFVHKDNKCVCDDQSYKDGDQCVFCDPALNLVPNGDKCVCKSGTFKDLKGNCVTQADCEAKLGKIEGGNCVCTSNATPNDTNECECDAANHYERRDNVCVCQDGYFSYNGTCSEAELCEKNFGQMNGNVCNCKLGAKKLQNGLCACNTDGHFIEDADSCVCDKNNGFELQDNVCKCQTGFYPDGNMCKYCDENKNLTINTEQNGCTCKTNYVTLSGSCIAAADCNSQEGYKVNGQNCECNVDDGYTLKDEKCVKAQNEEQAEDIPETNRKSTSTNIGLIVGIAIGVLVLVVVAVVVAIILKRRKARKQENAFAGNRLRRIVTEERRADSVV